MAQTVRYVAMARLSDGLKVASYRPQGTSTDEVEATVSKVLSSGNIKPATQLSVVINDEQGTMHLAARTDDVLVVVTSAAYPRRNAFTMLTDLQEQTSAYISLEALAACTKPEELSKACHSWLKEVFRQYNDLVRVDKLTAVNLQVDEVRMMMEGNINRIIDNAESLNTVEDKAENLRSNAMQFQRQSEDLRRILWWRNFKMKVIVGLLVGCILGYILIPIFVNLSKASESGD